MFRAVVFTVFLSFAFMNTACCQETVYKKFKNEKGEEKDIFEYNMDRIITAAKQVAGDDEVIDRKEFKDINDQLKTARKITGETPEVEYTALFNLFDVDQNDKLSIKEYTIGAIQYQEFMFYDTSHDNKLNLQELMMMFDTPDKVEVEGTEDIRYKFSGKTSFVEFFHRMHLLSKLAMDWPANLGFKRFTPQLLALAAKTTGAGAGAGAQ